MKKTYNIDNLPLFINCDYMSVDGVQKTAHIQTKGITTQTQDAKIGDFCANWWIRPRKAIKREKYTTLSAYKKACSNCLIKNKIAITVTRYYTEDNTTL